MHLKRHQRGLTLTGLIMGCILIGGAALTGMKLWPIYNEKYTVDLAMEKLGTLPNADQTSRTELAKVLKKQFDIQGVNRFNDATTRQTLKVARDKKTKAKVARFAYEIRSPFFGDLDLVLSYDKVVNLSTSKTD